MRYVAFYICCHKPYEQTLVMQGLASSLSLEGGLNIGHQTNVEISESHKGPFINIHEGFLGFPTVWQSLC